MDWPSCSRCQPQIVSPGTNPSVVPLTFCRPTTHEIARWPTLRDEFPLPAGEGQGEGEGGLQRSWTWGLAWRGALFSIAQSSRLHRQFAGALVCGACLSPHPGPLPEERENRAPRFRQSQAPRLVAARDTVFPRSAHPHLIPPIDAKTRLVSRTLVGEESEPADDTIPGW